MKKKWRIFAVSIIVGMFMMTGCSSASNEAQTATTPDSQNSSNSQSTDKGPLKIGMTKTEYRPIQWVENDQWNGYDYDLIKLIAEQMSREIEVVPVEWKSIFDNLAKGDYDLAVSAINITDERKKTMLFSVPYFDSSTVIVTTKDKNIKTGKDLTGVNVGIQKDTSQYDSINSNVPGVNFMKFESSHEPLDALIEKKVDAAVVDLPVGLYFAEQNKDKDYIAIQDKELFQTVQWGIAAKMGNDQLISEVNAAYKKLVDSGKIDELYKKYFGSSK